MSTKIYDAVKIKTGSIKVLVGIAKKISKIELKEMIDMAVEKYRPIINKLGLTYSTEGLRDIVKLISALASTSEVDKYKEFIQDYAVKKGYGFDENSISLLLEIAKDLSGCKKLSFLGVDAATTLMKWYSLSEKTEKWIYDHFEDFHYQNATDGYSISDIVPSIAQEFDEFTQEGLSRCKSEEDKKRYLSERKKAANDIAYLLFSQREKVWEKAMNGAFTMSECSLSYELKNSWDNDLEHLMLTVIALCD